MGMNNGLHRDMWKYDTAKNAWTQIANFGGPSRIGAVGFSIGGKGYVGTGQDSTKPLGCCKYTTGMCRDFWEYDTAANTWTQKAQFGGSGRYYAVAFSYR
jgi:N-acetylneuraminic acid mutarotase